MLATILVAGGALLAVVIGCAILYLLGCRLRDQR